MHQSLRRGHRGRDRRERARGQEDPLVHLPPGHPQEEALTGAPGALPEPSRQLRLEIDGALDRHALEALRLEIRRLGRRYGLVLKDLRTEEVRPARPRSRG
jgi:hypothetical protein